jgi:hypothetical protein
MNTLNSWGSSIKDGISGFSLTDALNIPGLTGSSGNLSNTLNPTISGVPGGSTGGGDKTLKDIADDTDAISDAVALSAEDLEYLRKIAATEWKKEFTTANITVDMTNYNTVDGDSDLDGIVTKLVSKLYEELDSVANGVYV